MFLLITKLFSPNSMSQPVALLFILHSGNSLVKPKSLWPQEKAALLDLWSMLEKSYWFFLWGAKQFIEMVYYKYLCTFLKLLDWIWIIMVLWYSVYSDCNGSISKEFWESTSWLEWGPLFTRRKFMDWSWMFSGFYLSSHLSVS